MMQDKSDRLCYACYLMVPADRASSTLYTVCNRGDVSESGTGCCSRRRMRAYAAVGPWLVPRYRYRAYSTDGSDTHLGLGARKAT